MALTRRASDSRGVQECTTRTAGGFRSFLEGVRVPHMLVLVEKSALANRLAKIPSTSPRSRRQLYRVKCSHLLAAIRLVPDVFFIDSWSEFGGYVGITCRLGRRLHVPERVLTQAPGLRPGSGAMSRNSDSRSDTRGEMTARGAVGRDRPDPDAPVTLTTMR